MTPEQVGGVVESICDYLVSMPDASDETIMTGLLYETVRGDLGEEKLLAVIRIVRQVWEKLR